MDRPPPPVEWENTDQPQTHSDHHDGCIPDWLGSHLSGNQNRRPLVTPGSTRTHQLTGTPGSLPGNTILPERQEECVGALAAGQHHCSSIHQQPGWDSVPSPDAASTEAVDVVSGERHLLDNTTPTRYAEFGGGLRVIRDRTDWHLHPSIFQQIDRRFGPLEVDLFASRLTTHLPRFFRWQPDPLAEATDAFLQDWSQFLGFANPPWCLLGRVLAQVHSQQARVILVVPVWKSQP